jgi:hypothetical protein
MLSRLILPTLAIAALSISSCSKSSATPYPVDTCPVSGNKLGAHGDPYVFTRDGQEVKLCCEACLEEFNANADKLLKEIAEAARRAH